MVVNPQWFKFHYISFCLWILPSLTSTDTSFKYLVFLWLRWVTSLSKHHFNHQLPILSLSFLLKFIQLVIAYSHFYCWNFWLFSHKMNIVDRIFLEESLYFSCYSRLRSIVLMPFEVLFASLLMGNCNERVSSAILMINFFHMKIMIF